MTPTDLEINTIFEEAELSTARVKVNKDQDPNKLWSEGKRVFVTFKDDGREYSLNAERIALGVQAVETRTQEVIDYDNLSPNSAQEILVAAIVELRKKLTEFPRG